MMPMDIMLSFGMDTTGVHGFPLWLMILCSLAISAGTFIGGKRIIKSVDHVHCCLFICWGAQAAMKHFYGVPKYMLDGKCFGVFVDSIRRHSPNADVMAFEKDLLTGPILRHL